jgi:hypothetical protein
MIIQSEIQPVKFGENRAAEWKERKERGEKRKKKTDR